MNREEFLEKSRQALMLNAYRVCGDERGKRLSGGETTEGSSDPSESSETKQRPLCEPLPPIEDAETVELEPGLAALRLLGQVRYSRDPPWIGSLTP